MDARRILARDAAVRRLKRLTTIFVAAAGILALCFSIVAAKAFPGRASHPVRKVTRAVTHPRTAPAAQQAPPLVSAGSPAQPQAPQQQASPAPAPTASSPVAVSGGS